MVNAHPMMSEQQLLDAVIDAAKLGGWRVCHVRPARTVNGWRTAYQGHAGLPDLILARGGVVLLAELKSQEGRVSTEQREWLAASGGVVWRPAELARVACWLVSRRGGVVPCSCCVGGAHAVCYS